MRTWPIPCAVCGTVVQFQTPKGKYCNDCYSKPRRRIRKPDALAAHREVAKAVREGLIPPASERICSDCCKPATEYDHRDYRYPLMVEPVCHSCNVKRGPAKAAA